MAPAAVRQGAWACFAISALTAAAAVRSLWGGAPWSSPEHVGAVVGTSLMVACGFGFLRASRSAALVAWVFVSLASVLVVVEPPLDPVALPTTAATWAFVTRGHWGVWALHRQRCRAGERAGPGFAWVGVPAATVVAVLMAYGLACELQWVPPTRALPGHRLAEHHLRTLRDQGVVAQDERVLWFYFGGLTSILEDGTVLTDRRVISYERLLDEPFLVSSPLARVERIELVQPGDLLHDTQVDVVTDDGDSFVLLLSAEAGGDARFLEALSRALPGPTSAPPRLRAVVDGP